MILFDFSFSFLHSFIRFLSLMLVIVVLMSANLLKSVKISVSKSLSFDSVTILFSALMACIAHTVILPD